MDDHASQVHLARRFHNMKLFFGGVRVAGRKISTVKSFLQGGLQGVRVKGFEFEWPTAQVSFFISLHRFDIVFFWCMNGALVGVPRLVIWRFGCSDELGSVSFGSL
jgi:hypothetical protein